MENDWKYFDIVELTKKKLHLFPFYIIFLLNLFVLYRVEYRNYFGRYHYQEEILAKKI